MDQDYNRLFRRTSRRTEQPLLDFRLYKNADRFSLKEERSGAPGNRTPLFKN